MGGAKCHDECYRAEFKERYDLVLALGKAYSEIIPVNDNEKNYREGYHFCPSCHIYIRNIPDVWCPCCGAKTRVARKNLRGKLIAKRYRAWAYGNNKLRTSIKNDINNNIDKWRTLLAS